MSASDLKALLPLILLGLSPLLIMLLVTVRRNHGAALLITLGGLAACFAAVLVLYGEDRRLTPLLIFDPRAAVYIGMLLIATGFTAVLSHAYLNSFDGHREEFYILLLLALLGAAVLASSTHFASLFLGLEILSVSLYALIAYCRLSARHVEAGLKYLVLAGVSSAFLLFGMALLFGASGTMDLARIGALMSAAAPAPGRAMAMTGAGLLAVGLAFKLAVVPFHWWTPDVYEGAPAPVTAFVATVSKGGVVALLTRLFAGQDLPVGGSLDILFAVLAAASMIGGNLLALLQDNVKRILACSSIAHLGYILVGFLAGGDMAPAAVAFYLSAYMIASLGAFGVISLLSTAENELDAMADYRGLFHSHPWLSGVFAAMLFSLAGIPLTAGFLGKIYVAAAAVGSARWVLVMVLAATSTIGLFYYLRIISAMFAQESVPAPAGGPGRPAVVPAAGSVVLALLAALLVWLGVAPSALIQVLRQSLG